MRSSFYTRSQPTTLTLTLALTPTLTPQVLFETLELPVVKKTPTGNPSTAEGVLAELATDYELPGLLLEWRSLAKLRSTYTDKLPAMVDPRTGRIHTTYHQVGVCGFLPLTLTQAGVRDGVSNP